MQYLEFIVLFPKMYFLVFTAPPCGAPDNGAAAALATC